MRLQISFGEIHAVTAHSELPEKPGVHYVETGCGFRQAVTPKNRNRFMIIPDDNGPIGCYICQETTAKDNDA